MSLLSKAVTVLLVEEQCGEKFSIQGGQVCPGCDWSSLCSDPLVKEDCKCFVVIRSCM